MIRHHRVSVSHRSFQLSTKTGTISELFGEDVRNSVWPIVIKEMHELEAQLVRELSRNYRTLLEHAVAGEVDGQFDARRTDLESRSKRFRQAMETLQEVSSTMQAVVVQTKP